MLCSGEAPAPENADPDILPQALLRKYITYAKQTCRPKLQAADYDKVAQVSHRRLVITQGWSCHVMC